MSTPLSLFLLYLLGLFFIFPSCEAKAIHEHGYWIGEDVLNEHAFDPTLAKGLIQFFQEEKAHSLVDFGCGRGSYIKILQWIGMNCEGYDGNPDSAALSGGIAQIMDVSQPVRLSHTFDWVLSLEVGEHIPKQYESTFIENLVHHAVHGIILSWAIPGQGGYGHVNTRENSYIKARLTKQGFSFDEQSSLQLRQKASLPWFKNTIMVFRRTTESQVN